MATKTYKINIDVESKTLGQLEDELSQINDELKQVDRNSEAFSDLAKKSQQLTSEIEKTNNAISGLKLEDKLQAADGAIKIFGGSLQTVVGSLGALGIESEVFGEFEKKAASAIAVGMGIKDVSEGFGQFTMVMKKSGIAAKIFGSTVNKALIATGIGAFIVALGLVVTYWDDITQAIGGASQETRDFLTDQEAVTAETIHQLDLLNSQDNVLKLQGLSEAEILNLKIAQTDEILLQLQLQKKAAKEVADEQIMNTARVMSFFNAGGGGVGGLIGKLFGYSPEGLAEISNKANEQMAVIDEQIMNIENTRAGYLLRKNALEAENDEVEVTQYREKVETVNAITQTKGVVALEVADMEVQALDSVAIANIQAKNADKAYMDAQIASQNQQQALQNALGATAGALSAVGSVLDQESTAAKALAIGSAIINTYLGVTQALATPAVPFIEPFATITRIANVAIVLASGLKAVANIKKTPPKATSAPGSANVSGGRGASSASPNAAATAMRTQIPGQFDTPDSISTTPSVRAYVVAGDVSSNQEAEAKISKRRTID